MTEARTKRLEVAAREATAARKRLVREIVAAKKAGMSLAEIARPTGLTRARISQIVHEQGKGVDSRS